MVRARAESREDNVPGVRAGGGWLIGERITDDGKVEVFSET